MNVAIKRRPGGRSARVRADVLRAALEELAAVGYAQLTIEGIAQRAGVNKTTLYRRWGSRENLVLEAMLERGAEHVPIPDTGSLREDLLQYGREIATALAGAPEIRATVRATAGSDPDSQLAEASRRFWKTRLGLASEIVERAIERGEARPGVDRELVAELVVAPIYFRLLLSGEPLDDDFLERLGELVAGGAAQRKRSASAG
jgi:AcrR family transcriptional regulator